MHSYKIQYSFSIFSIIHHCFIASTTFLSFCIAYFYTTDVSSVVFRSTTTASSRILSMFRLSCYAHKATDSECLLIYKTLFLGTFFKYYFLKIIIIILFFPFSRFCAVLLSSDCGLLETECGFKYILRKQAEYHV